VVQAAEDGARDDPARRAGRGRLCRAALERRLRRQTATGPLGGVESHVLLEHGLQVLLDHDQHVIEALPA
jgi:hypothetical protein